MAQRVEFGLDTFGDRQAKLDGELETYAQTIRNVVDEGVLADSVGVDFFAIGEHHRDDFAVSSPELLLAAIATRTERIKLGTAVTVLSSDDPVRLYERFATLEALSHGRAEVILGRGSFTESFPLFGFPLQDYETLFEEKIDLWSKLVTEEPVTWEGTKRAALTDQEVFPKTEGGIRTWVGVGGSPESVVRAAHYGFPLVLAIIGGDPARFAPYADLYKRALGQFGKAELPIASHSPGFVADTDHDAKEQFWPHYRANVERIGKERGWPPPSRAQFDQEIANGALHLGSPETVAKKIVHSVTSLGLSRFDLKYAAGTLPHASAMHSIELYGTKVIPLVREMLAEADDADTAKAADRDAVWETEA